MTDNSNGKPSLSATSVAVGAFGGVVLLTAGLIGGTLITRAQDPAPNSSGTSSATEAPKESVTGGPLVTLGQGSETIVDTIGVSEPDVTAWHDEVRPAIGAVLNMLTGEAPTTGAQLRTMCETLSLTLNDINSSADAPRADVNKQFRAWAALLTSAVSDCSASADSPDAEALQTAKQSFSETVQAFDDFMLTLDLYYDFSISSAPAASAK